MCWAFRTLSHATGLPLSQPGGLWSALPGSYLEFSGFGFLGLRVSTLALAHAGKAPHGSVSARSGYLHECPSSTVYGFLGVWEPRKMISWGSFIGAVALLLYLASDNLQNC